MTKPIHGFSKLDKSEKINWLAKNYLNNDDSAISVLKQYWNTNDELQKLHDEFIENTVSNFYLPLGLAPNFRINGKYYVLPMAIEESSVVAAASKAAKFWDERGGFKASVLNTKKIGQVHFLFQGEFSRLDKLITKIKPKLREAVKPITRNMEKRGGGILDINLIDKTSELDNYYQLFVNFDTRDSMGANFINSCLEKFAEVLQEEAQQNPEFTAKEKELNVIMSILSNYVPECIVRAEVSCPVEDLSENEDMTGQEFAEKFIQAVKIAEIEPYRAVTHNKGVMNGIDAVVLATGNDFRAVEAGVHAYASRNGRYTSLTHAEIENGIFKFWMEIPLALGTVGGLTSLHPLVKLALDILQRPSANDLMKITAVAGLAQNFAALRSLTTTGIQQGHMKMHLMNILNQNQATDQEKEELVEFFTHHTITHSSVIEQLENLRS
ncbi:hydroxymethylglutaryl-CoA reductase, degradative [Christiangramia sabulilitoris]|uniref:3-hydroxy-3-methylglutaryl coenzyme A reductase n=1 Tax=Christiangramia sabulilitoris TaxID=2583991 RepID=A0A550I7Y2_9FLAO|nr:hydroxymethylglutaryl-CoA reductase, degradative [Christiangramia sabulilitoris]TRO67082.1 hydroxymethylglutaryl-CoA reductase, degradative [Christiangramia sabulilitoris]